MPPEQWEELVRFVILPFPSAEYGTIFQYHGHT